MNKALLAILTILVAFHCCLADGLDPENKKSSPKKEPAFGSEIECFFNQDCEKAVIKEVRVAREEILIAVFSFTRKAIADALVAVAKAGVKVSIKYDVGQAEYKPMQKLIDFMKGNGIECCPIKLDGENNYMHHKFMVIDRGRVLTGSYNFTTAGMSNFENVVIIPSKELAKRYRDAFKKIKDRR